MPSTEFHIERTGHNEFKLVIDDEGIAAFEGFYAKFKPPYENFTPLESVSELLEFALFSGLTFIGEEHFQQMTKDLERKENEYE